VSADQADAIARWTAHLDALEATLTDDPASAPAPEGLPPLPAELAPRADRVLQAVRAAAGDLTAQRDAVARELDQLHAPRPRAAHTRPVYLDATG
jgi:hypothetical protein